MRYVLGFHASRLSFALLFYLAGAPLVLMLAFQHPGAFRLDLGASDEAFLTGNPSAWGRGYQDRGPFRIRRGVRWMTHFAARMAYPGAGLRIPVAVEGGDAELRLRVHRYGQPGIIHVLGNGAHLGSLVFRRDSYPWDVRRLRVPARMFRTGPLRLEFQGEDTVDEVDLPPGALLSFDWIELGPAEPGARLRPVARLWFYALLLPALVFVTLRWSGVPSWLSEGASAAVLGVLALAHALAPGPTAAAIQHLWVVFPLGGIVWVVLRGALKVGPKTARRLTAAFTLVLLAHSTIIFFPRHLPPDLGPHLGQIRLLSDSRWSLDRFWEFSSSFGVTGKGKPHFGADYEAPYPPWTYLAVHGLRQLADRPRFLLEFFGMVCGALLMLFTFGLARRLSADGSAAGYAAALVALEISIWHHASRVHVPGLLGELLFVAALTYLLHHHRDLRRPRVFLTFAFLSLATTIAYTATLFHFVLFMAWLFALNSIGHPSLRPSAWAGRALAAAAGGTLASFALFYRRFVRPALASKDAILAVKGYRAPATFFFLRNQMRDTARILSFGYPVWVLLAAPAYWRLRDWASGVFARRFILAWTAAYLLLLVLKDPTVLPQLFLHAKEDLFFAPLACVLGGMTLNRVASRMPHGRVLVAATFALLLVLQVHDYLYNADTIAAWASGGG